MLTGSEDRRVEARTIPGKVTRVGGAPGARAAIVIRDDQARLVLSDVQGPADGQIYQAWLEHPPAKPVFTGALFSIGVSGDTTIGLPPLRGAQRMIVTSEPSPGSTIPTLPPIVIVDLPTATRTSR